jgi:hypothetical protein
MSPQNCPLCHRRRSKRECPALGRGICAVCCGTKRQTEIACPADCSYLSASRAHPAAVVQRRRERDYRFLLPLVSELGERPYRLLLALQALILKHSAAALPAPVDADVAEAAATAASTIETARKGIIYEHQASSVPAQRLVVEIRNMFAEIAREATVPSLDRDAAVVLRRIEDAARRAAAAFPEDGSRSYVAFLSRVMSDADRPGTAEAGGTVTESGSGLIIPG